jgi:hypothetical protein
VSRCVHTEGVTGSIPVAPTIQSYETADFQVESKQAISVGIFAGIFLSFRSPVITCGLSGRFGPPVSASQNSVPRGPAATANTVGQPGNIVSLLGQNGPFGARALLIAGSIRGLQTAGSILQEHHEVARLQCRVANDLRLQRARDLVQGTRVRSSC